MGVTSPRSAPSMLQEGASVAAGGAARYDAAAQRRQHKQTGGVGHPGDVANILAALQLRSVPQPTSRFEALVIAQLRDASEGLGADELLIARTGRAVRVHEISPAELADVADAWRRALWEAAAIGGAVGLFQGILEETIGGNLTSQLVRDTQLDQEAGAEAGGSIYSDAFWLNGTILVLGFILSALVESHMLVRCALRAAGRMVALLGVHFAAETAAEVAYVRAVCEALFSVEPDDAAAAWLGIRLDGPTQNAQSCCRVHRTYCKSAASIAMRVLANWMLTFVFRTTVRGFLPYIGVPLYAAINAIVLDRQLRSAWCCLAGLPTALEITEELLQMAHMAKLRLHGSPETVGAGIGLAATPRGITARNIRHHVHWAPISLASALESAALPSEGAVDRTRTVTDWSWSEVQSLPTTGPSRLEVAWYVMQLLDRPQFMSAREQFAQGVVPSDKDLRALAHAWWGDGTAAAAATIAGKHETIVPSHADRMEGRDQTRMEDHGDQTSASNPAGLQVEWFRSWFKERVALMQMREKCSPLEPEGWDQLRRCCAALMIEQGVASPVQELVVEYLLQQAGGDLVSPLVPERPCVPVDGEAVSSADVNEIVRYQAELTVEDREVVLCVLVLLVIVEGRVTPVAENLLTRLLEQSQYTVPTSAGELRSRRVLPTESWDFEELAQVTHEFGHFKRRLSVEDVMRLVSGESVYAMESEPNGTRLRIRPPSAISSGSQIRRNIQANLAMQQEMLRRVGRKQRFTSHRNKLHSANGLVIIWSALSLVVNSTALSFSSHTLHQLWLIILFYFYSLCTAALGVIAVQKEWMGVFQSYFILHFLAMLLNILLVGICFVSLPHVQDVVDENWTAEDAESLQLPKMIAWVRAMFCGENEQAKSANLMGVECRRVVVSTLRSYVMMTAWGGCVVFLLLMLSVRSAMVIIFSSSSPSHSSGDSGTGVIDRAKEKERGRDVRTSLRRDYTLFLLINCADLFFGVLFTAWAVFKIIWWPNPAAFWHVDALIMFRGMATFIQAFVGIVAVRKVILGCMRAHICIALLQLAISAFFLHSSIQEYYSWQRELTPTYVGETTRFNFVPCDERCMQADNAPAMPHPACFAAAGASAPEVAIDAGWNGTTLLSDTPQPLQLGSPEIAAVLTELWSLCDERCSNDNSMCTSQSYRACDLEPNTVARSPIAVASYLFFEAARNETGTELTLSNCTCSEHLNCVMGLKLGFLNQTNVLLVLSFVLTVMLLFDLAASYSLHSRWGVFVARGHGQSPTHGARNLAERSV
eukprot:COSAG02_NODE_1365_length_13037_cov_4.315659_3_plen_1275_part_00